MEHFGGKNHAAHREKMHLEYRKNGFKPKESTQDFNFEKLMM